MTPLDALGPFQRAVARQLRTVSISAIAALFLAAAVALALYCLGHAALTRQPLQPELTALWSLAHGAGVAGLIGGAAGAACWRARATFCFSLAGGLLGSGLVFRIGDALLTGAPWHHYTSITLYLATAVVLAWILWPRTPPATLAVDFGRTRERIPIERVVAVRGARNYAELTIAGDQRTGLVRTTLSGLEKQFPGELVRTQRSWLVNPRHLTVLRHGGRGSLVLEMTGGLEVPVTAAHAGALLRDPRFVPGAEDPSRRAGLETWTG